MDCRLVCKYLGILISLLSLVMILPLGWGFYHYIYEGGNAEIIYSTAASIGVTFFSGLAFVFFGRKSKGNIEKREAFLLVSSVWFVGSLLASFPFWFWALIHQFTPGEDASFLNLINCYFEAMSGLTTTGATVLSKIGTIPQTLIFWRSLTHWVGGLGIVVLFVAVLPLFGGGGAKRLFGAEASGIANEGASTNVRENSRNLIFIYLLLTLFLVLLLKIVDPSLSWFATINHSLSTLATGGYSTWDASAGVMSAFAQWIVVFFMMLAGVNFAVYQQIYKGRLQKVLQDTELKAYLLSLFVCSLIIGFWIYGTEYHTTQGELADSTSFDVALHSLFQVVSIQTSTGFATVNYDQWESIPKAVIVWLMLVGGCGGSTAGGIKMIRIVAALKIMRVEIEKAFRPSVVRPIRIGSHKLEYKQRASILTYILGVFGLMVIGSILLFLTEPSAVSSESLILASIASVNNIGPGFAEIGPVNNFGFFSNLGKIILSILMAAGRLEVFAVVVLFTPGFWKSQ